MILKGDRGDGQLPLLLSLASEERARFLMENLELTAEPAMLARVVQVLEQAEVKFTCDMTFGHPMIFRWQSCSSWFDKIIVDKT